MAFSLVFFGHSGEAFAVVDGVGNPPRILIVPGHEPDYGGAEFGALKERNFAVELGQDLEKLLRADTTYKVFITRDTKAWQPWFADYFVSNWDGIIAWEKKAKKDMARLISIGSTTRVVPTIIHNKADTDVGVRLYGITKWANDNSVDLVLHIHFNDDPIRSGNAAGNYSGFVIYVPPAQYSNGPTAHAIAKALFRRLERHNPVSNLKQESAGIVDDPELIAVGANNTSKIPSLLIEYDYIYARQLVNPKTRSLALRDLAYATYLGLQDYFGKEGVSVPRSYGTAIMPYLWQDSVTPASSVTDIYALQTALSAFGEYPPKGKTKNDCPRSGTFGSCTKAALASFQKKNGVSGEDGLAGDKTISILSGYPLD